MDKLKARGNSSSAFPRACVGELPCGSQQAAPKIGSMTKIVFPQVQDGYKLKNMKSAAFPYL